MREETWLEQIAIGFSFSPFKWCWRADVESQDYVLRIGPFTFSLWLPRSNSL